MGSRAIASRQQIIKKLEKRLKSETLELHFLSMVGKVLLAQLLHKSLAMELHQTIGQQVEKFFQDNI